MKGTTFYATGKGEKRSKWDAVSFKSLTIEELVHLARRRASRKLGLKVVLIDYLMMVGEPK